MSAVFVVDCRKETVAQNGNRVVLNALMNDRTFRTEGFEIVTYDPAGRIVREQSLPSHASARTANDLHYAAVCRNDA